MLVVKLYFSYPLICLYVGLLLKTFLEKSEFF